MQHHSFCCPVVHYASFLEAKKAVYEKRLYVKVIYSSLMSIDILTDYVLLFHL